MTKLVQTLNVMIQNAVRISNVARDHEREEYYFRYDDKYTWSVAQDNDSDTYWVYFYPHGETPDTLANSDPWENLEFVSYSTKELKTREAIETIQELLMVAKERLYNVDSVFDDIISQDESE